jgi:NADH-quinone oxidoreductase subunit E
LCAVLGGDAIWNAVSNELNAGHDETTADGTFTLERIECQAACTHAPVVTFDWEFFDNATIESVKDAVAKLQRGEEVQSTRGPKIGGLNVTERQLAGFDDDLVHAAAMDAQMLAGLNRAKEVGQTLSEKEV